MSCSLSQQQEALLQDHFREVVLFLDGDTAGRRAGASIAQLSVAKTSSASGATLRNVESGSGCGSVWALKALPISADFH